MPLQSATSAFTGTLMLATLTSNTFSQYINDRFTLSVKDTPAATMTLISVTEKPAAAHTDAARVPFGLVFRAENHAVISDGCFTLDHPGLGNLPDVYFNRILPPAPTDTSAYYQAIFN